MSQELRSFRAVVPPGLEFVTVRELEGLGLEVGEADAGGVAFTGTLEQAARVHYEARSINRVFMRLGSFHAADFKALQRGVRALDWSGILTPGAGLAVRAVCHRSRLYHSDAVAERVAGALGEQLDAPDAPGVLVRLQDDTCEISADMSGELLHKRGYREDVGKAPLRETTAAALLLASGYTGDEPLVNPACGTGSLAVEAALIALRRSPGALRSFAFERWPFAAGLPSAPVAAPSQRAAPSILAFDRSEEALSAARDNAARAGCAEAIEFTARDIDPLVVPARPGLLICNPPWGHRLGSRKSLQSFYHRFGQSCAPLTGWRVAILSTDKVLRQTFERSLKRGPSQLRTFQHGGLRVTWTLYHLK